MAKKSDGRYKTNRNFFFPCLIEFLRIKIKNNTHSDLTETLASLSSLVLAQAWRQSAGAHRFPARVASTPPTLSPAAAPGPTYQAPGAQSLPRGDTKRGGGEHSNVICALISAMFRPDPPPGSIRETKAITAPGPPANCTTFDYG